MTTPDVNIKTNQTLHKAALQAYFLEADTKEDFTGKGQKGWRLPYWLSHITKVRYKS